MHKPAFAVCTEATAKLYELEWKLVLPTELPRSHTAVVGGYIVEGYVAAANVKWVLAATLPMPGSWSRAVASVRPAATQLVRPHTAQSTLWPDNGRIVVLRNQGYKPLELEYARLAGRYDRRWRRYIHASIHETLKRLEVAAGHY
ncbi:MAG: DUF411 domain-containing protein [Wenzhouxiangellaceae bacterium]|nr:DUF411 domain-containing protein [Wenzhouxiangellaceae bacterium]